MEDRVDEAGIIVQAAVNVIEAFRAAEVAPSVPVKAMMYDYPTSAASVAVTSSTGSAFVPEAPMASVTVAGKFEAPIE